MLNLIETRQELHKIPELAFHEWKTKLYLEAVLKQYESIKIHSVAKTGLLIEYSHGSDDYTMFRADMDALPIKEKTNCTFISTHDGFMHACGHDLHMTILLGLIDFVVKSSVPKNILFLFQPAEEGKGGAKLVLKEEILKEFTIKNCFALHVSGNYPIGTIAAKAGVFFANTQEIDVRIKGKSAHVAFPENGIDTINAMRLFLTEVDLLLQKFSQQNKPVLCYFGKICSGTVRNAISDYSHLEGTVRALQEEVFQEFNKELKLVAKKIMKQTRANIEISLTNFYQSVVNDKMLVDRLKSKCDELEITFQEVNAEMTGEDFGYFSQLYPSLLFWLGASEKGSEDLHSPFFLPSEKAIEIGLRVFKSFVLK